MNRAGAAAAVWGLWPDGVEFKFSVYTPVSAKRSRRFLNCRFSYKKLMEMFHFDEVKTFHCNFIFIILSKYFSKVEIL